jgi:hypothetical protein
MKTQRIIYWIATIGICAIMCYSASMYFMNTEMVKSFFESFNYPTYIVIPLAVLKICAVLMLLWRGIPWLTEWAYAGIFFDVVLAAMAHYHAGDSITFTLVALVLLLISYFFGKEVRPMYYS